jgi:hypothetical protein
VPLDIASQIAASGLSIYDKLDGHPELFLASADLENLLNSKLAGMDLNYPNRTRSKKLKEAVCVALGYPIPKSFKKTQPRFPGQDFDTYVQKSNNLQIWNEEVFPSRRYVLIRVDDDGILTRVKIIAGEELAKFDKTGTLTQKYQARIKSPLTESLLVSKADTANLQAKVFGNPQTTWQGLLPIQDVYKRLLALEGKKIVDPGIDQDRNRGAELHKIVSDCLGIAHRDSGQFPDIYEQLIEVKLQTAATIDLGLVCPDDPSHLSSDLELRHCDVRYVVFYGTTSGEFVTLGRFVLTTGEDFFTAFQRFEGKVTNAKLQLPLPRSFFDAE